MAYTKIGWVNDRTPAINQNNLNHMDQGIYDAHQELAEYEDIFTGDVDESVQNWLDEHPEATTTVPDNSLTTAKYKDGSVTESKIAEGAITESKIAEGLSDLIQLKSFDVQLFKEFSLSVFSSEIIGNYAMQGVCYNKETDQFIFLFSDNSNWENDSLIIVTDSNFNKASEHNAQLWHANDITFNAVANKYYVAPSHADAEIIEMDSDFTSIRSIYINGITETSGNNIVQIAYDESEDCYFVTTGNKKTYKLNSELAVIMLVADQADDSFTLPTYPNVHRFDIQAVDTYNQLIMSVAWFWRTSDSGITRVGVFDPNSQECVYKYDYEHSIDNEPEGICVFDGFAYIFSYNANVLEVRKLFFNTQAEHLFPFDHYEKQVSIDTAWSENFKITANLRSGKYLINAYTSNIAYVSDAQYFRGTLKTGSSTIHTTVQANNNLPYGINFFRVVDLKVDTTVEFILMSNQIHTGKTVWLNLDIMKIMEG